MEGEDDDDEDDEDEDEDEEDEDDDDDYDTKVWKPFLYSLMSNITSAPFPASDYVLTFFSFPPLNRRPRELLEGKGSKANDLQSASSSKVLHIEYWQALVVEQLVWFCLMQCH